MHILVKRSPHHSAVVRFLAVLSLSILQASLLASFLPTLPSFIIEEEEEKGKSHGHILFGEWN